MKQLLCVISAALTGLAAVATPNYCVEMTTSGYAGTEELKNFPVLVKFAENQPSGFSYSQLRADAYDLSFEDADGNRLAYELDTWDPSGTSCVWVKVPALTATTKIIAKWGDDAVTGKPAEQAKGAVWGAAGYAGVWHFSEENGTAYDSTANGLDGEAKGANVNELVPYESSVVGKARQITTPTTKNKNYFEVAYSSALDLGATLTASGWFKGTAQSNGRMFSTKSTWNGAAGWETQWKASNQVQARGADGAGVTLTIPSSTQSGWVHLSFVFDGANLDDSGKCDVKVWCNGVHAGNIGPTLPPADNKNHSLLLMSDAGFGGGVDEMRIKSGLSSSDWIKAEYDTVMRADFLVAGGVIDFGSIDAIKVEADLNDTVGDVTPGYGKVTNLTDGQVVDFSASDEEYDVGDGMYLSFVGYQLYVTVNGTESLAKESSSLSGSYTHVAGQGARLVWLQSVRKGGASFATAFSSIVSVPGYTADGAMHNVQVLFRLSENAPEGFHYADCQANGADILFTDANGHTLAYEVETWNPDGESLFWVNLPTLTKDTTFRFAYGNVEITKPQNEPTEVWAYSGFAGVWHMNEPATDDNVLEAKDSTANANDGKPFGKDTTQMLGVDGVIGGARQLDSGAVNTFEIADSEALHLGSTFTVSGWFKGTPVSNGRVFCKKSLWNGPEGWEVQWKSATSTTFRGSAGDNQDTGIQEFPSIASNWGFFVWVYENDKGTFYANGKKVGECQITTVKESTTSLKFGGDKLFKGSFDEIRLQSGAVSEARVKVNYDIVANAGFLKAAKVSAAGDSDTFTIEAGDTERGTVTPAWGKMERRLEDGETVSFSAPEGEQDTDDPNVHFKFTGYELYVTEDGVEKLAEKKPAVSGVYTHVAGQTARLVWFTVDMPKVAVTANEGGTITGAGFYALGETVTLTATPEEGMRFKGWSGNLPDGVKATDTTIAFVVDNVYALTATFAVKPTCVAFYGLAAKTAGETVMRLENEIDASKFGGTAQIVESVAGAGRFPTYENECPAKRVYTDATRNTLLVESPKAISFGPADPANVGKGGAAIPIENLATYISGEDAVTVECFVRTRFVKNGSYLAVWSADVGNDPHVVFGPYQALNIAAFSCETDNSGHLGNIQNKNLTGTLDEAWHHYAVVYDRTEQKAHFFVDYVEVVSEKGEFGKDISIQKLETSVPLYLGSAIVRSNKKDQNFDGWISCLRVTRGALETEDFMRAEYAAEDDGTLALFDLRGPTGQDVGAFKSKAGELTLEGAGEVLKSGSNWDKTTTDVALPTWSDDAPNTAIFANAADKEAKKPLVKRTGSIAFNNTESTQGSYVILRDLSTVISSQEKFTVEFFAKNEGLNTWKTAFCANFIGEIFSGTPTKIALPGSAKTKITVQKPSEFSYDTGKDLTVDDVWHHLALTYDGEKLHLFVDYAERGSTAMTRIASTAPVILGGSYGPSDARAKESFVGKISTLRVTNRVLSSDEFLVAGERPNVGLVILAK